MKRISWPIKTSKTRRFLYCNNICELFHTKRVVSLPVVLYILTMYLTIWHSFWEWIKEVLKVKHVYLIKWLNNQWENQNKKVINTAFKMKKVMNTALKMKSNDCCTHNFVAFFTDSKTYACYLGDTCIVL